MKTIAFCIFILTSTLFAQNHGSWSLTDSLGIPSLYAASVNLVNGNVLVSGGEDSVGIRNTEVYDYRTEKWTNLDPMIVGRANHLLLRLKNENILAIGGFGTRSCEIYDTTSKIWDLTDSLNYERSYGETATLLNNGNVLVAGGFYLAVGNSKYLNSCEIYNISTGKWAVTDSLKIDREYHTATKLLDGRVLIAGGFSGTQKELKDCELYDPNTGKWSEAAPLNIARSDHSATLLPDGKVLVTGGENYSNPTSPWLRSCELYDPVQDKWTIVDSLLESHSLHSAVLLNNGMLLITGGSINTNIWELYNPQNFSNVYLGNYPNDTVATNLINLLPNGKVLASGGMTWTNGSLPVLSATKVCYLYDPNGVSKIENENSIVNNFKLFQNYPNPFNPSTTIKYALPKYGFVTLRVYDVLGREVATLVNNYEAAGTYNVTFDASNLVSGVYIYRLRSGIFIATKKLLLMK